MKSILISMIAALSAALAWFVVSQEEPQPQVVVLPGSEASPASAVLPTVVYDGTQSHQVSPTLPKKAVQALASTTALVPGLLEENNRHKEYKASPAVRAYKDRRVKIQSEFYERVNKQRSEQGLGPSHHRRFLRRLKKWLP